MIGIGSAQEAYTFKNPFTLGERVKMIWLTLRAVGLLDRCIITGIPDTNNKHSLWVSVVQHCCPPFNKAYSNDPLTKILFRNFGVPVEGIPFYNRSIYEATRIREAIATGKNWEEYVHFEVAKFIKTIKGDIRIRELYKLKN